ncbi:cystathionine beta-lyase, partial [Streptomyces sp. MCAF7]
MKRADSQASRDTSQETRTDPLARLSLEQLRKRTSMKWRAHPEDVLPLWVAEMDVPLAPPVAEALHTAIDAGDTGYPYGTAYAEALAEFARERWQWDGLRIEHTAIVPDVMLGIVEVLRLITDPGDAVVVCSPVYPP